MQGKVDRIADGVVRGWLRDAKRPGQRLIADILLDGAVIGSVVADRRRGDLVDAKIGDGLHGFEISVPETVDQTRPLRVTMQTQFGGAAITIDERLITPQFAPVSITGKLEGIRSGAIHGWAWDKKAPERRLTIVFCHEGEVIGEAVAGKPRADLLRAKIGDGEHGFAKPLSELPKTLGETPVLQAFVIDGAAPVPLGSLTLVSGWRPPVADIGAKVAQPRVESEIKAAAAVEAPVAAEPAKVAKEKPAPAKPAAAKPAGKAVASTPAQSGKKLNLKEEIAKSSAAESKGDLAEAHAILEAILAVDPKNIEALFRRARVALSMGNVEEAKQFATAVVERQKDHPKAHVTLARVAEMEGQRNLALEYWTKVPKNESAYRERLLKSGRILAAIERPREGLAALADAVALKPDDVAARKSLLRLARDINDLSLAQGQREALEAIGAPVTETSLLPKTLSESESVIRRYDGAMSHMQDPVVLGIGSDLQACLIGGIFAGALAAHFDTQIDVVVPEATPAANLLLGNNKCVRQLLTAENCAATYELAIILPEFALSTDEETPTATLRCNFMESRSLGGGSLQHRIQAYRSWLGEIIGAPQQIFDEASLAIPGARNGKRLGPALLLERNIANEWPGFQTLIAMLETRGVSAVRFDVTGPFDNAETLGRLLKAINGAGVVVTADETLAAMAALMKAPVVFAAGATSGQVLRELAPAVAIVPAGGDPCAEKSTTRWKAMTGACECLRSVGPGIVMEALEQLSADPFGARLERLTATAAAE